jgi:hypothetical protein
LALTVTNSLLIIGGKIVSKSKANKSLDSFIQCNFCASAYEVFRQTSLTKIELLLSQTFLTCFRCQSVTAIKAETSKGRIISQDNSGTVGVGEAELLGSLI